MNTIEFIKNDFLISDFIAKGSSGRRNMIQNVEGGYYYDLYSTSVANHSYVINTDLLTQVTEFRAQFYTRRVGPTDSSSLGVLLDFPSGGFIVFDKNFEDPFKMNVFVSSTGVYPSSKIASSDSYSCVKKFPNFELNSWNNIVFKISNSNSNSKIVTFILNGVIIFEGSVDFKDLSSEKFNIGIHNYNNDIMNTNITLIGDDSSPVVNNKTDFQYWRISNIKNRRSDQTYRSVGNLLFTAKTGESSDNPAYGFSESSYSQETLPGNAFDGLNSTYTLSSSLGESWWVGYKFPNPVELKSIGVSMRYDMKGIVDGSNDNSLGQDWVSFQVEGSETGNDWNYVYACYNPKIFKNDTSVHRYIPENFKISAKWWRIKNIETRYKQYYRSVNEIYFYDNDKKEIPITDLSKAFALSYYSEESSPSKAFDRSESDLAHIADGRGSQHSYDWYIGYEFDIPQSPESLGIKLRSDLPPNLGREWQTADIEYSYNGVDWFLAGVIKPYILPENSDLNITPIEFATSASQLSYTPIVKDPSDKKYKFWRCSNIKTEPSEEKAILNNSIAKLDFKNTENLKISSIYNSFSSSNERLGSSGYLRTSEFAFDENPETHAHSRTAIDSAENYTIGCMFDTPVEVTSLGIQARHDLNTIWGETWQSCTVEKSENGFDWHPTAYCIFNTPKAYTGYLESELFSLDSLGPKYKFWRVINPFYRNLKNTLEFSLWELRFNTLTGEISNNPSKAFSNSSWSTSYLPKNAFDTNTSTGVYPEKDFQEPYYIGYEFNTPQYVNSLYILLRRDNALLNEYLLFIEVQASEDGVTWVSQGYSNLDTLSDSLFCLSYIEPYKLIDKLSVSSLEYFTSVSFKELEFKPFGSTLIDTNNISINIYNKDNDGTISGEVTELDIPVIREVGLYDRATRQLIAITWSDEKGQYKFTGIDSTRKYYVHAIDSNDFYNAVTQDMIEPLI